MHRGNWKLMFQLLFESLRMQPLITQVRRGLERFRQEVEEGSFPQEQYSPYKMSGDEEETFRKLLAKVPFSANTELAL